MYKDPNSVLSEILKEKDEDFRKLQERLQILENEFWAADPSDRSRIRRQMMAVKERVDARLSLARSV